MKSREELRNDYEEALFAMIMDEIMDLEGEALIAERERLALSEEDKLSNTLNEKCIAVINDTFEVKNKEARKLRIRKVLRTVLVAAVVMSIMFTTVYASVPAVRRATDNLISVVYDVSTKLLYGSESDIQVSPQYIFRYVPDGFMLTQEGREHNLDWYEYKNENATIIIKINYNTRNREIDIDSENASRIENVEIGCFKGVLVIKDNIVRVSIVDECHTNLIQINAVNMEYQEIIEMIEKIHYTGI